MAVCVLQCVPAASCSLPCRAGVCSPAGWCRHTVTSSLPEGPAWPGPCWGVSPGAWGPSTSPLGGREVEERGGFIQLLGGRTNRCLWSLQTAGFGTCTCGRNQVIWPRRLAMGVERSENSEESSAGKSGSWNSPDLTSSSSPPSSSLMARREETPFQGDILASVLHSFTLPGCGFRGQLALYTTHWLTLSSGFCIPQKRSGFTPEATHYILETAVSAIQGLDSAIDRIWMSRWIDTCSLLI